VKLLHRYLIWLGQRKSGAAFLAAGRHPKGAIEGVLGDNKVLFILVDVALPEMRDLRPVKFFGQDFVLPWGLIMVKYMTQAAFHIGYIVRDPEAWEKQTLIVTPELTFVGKLAQDHQAMASELEKVVRQYPEFWWGWGLMTLGRPETVQEARRRKDYSTAVLGKEKERARGGSR
jgi:lauroyl/myristoyl acyltransferase